MNVVNVWLPRTARGVVGQRRWLAWLVALLVLVLVLVPSALARAETRDCYETALVFHGPTYPSPRKCAGSVLESIEYTANWATEFGFAQNTSCTGCAYRWRCRFNFNGKLPATPAPGSGVKGGIDMNCDRSYRKTDPPDYVEYYGPWESNQSWAGDPNGIAVTVRNPTPVIERYHAKNNCSATPGFGDPIYPTTGAITATVELDNAIDLPLRLQYDTTMKVPASLYDNPVERKSVEGLGFQGFVVSNVTSLRWLASYGSMWSSNVHKFLQVEAGPPVSVRAYRGSSKWVTFDTALMPDADVNDRVIPLMDGRWRYIDSVAQTIETYNAAGFLMTQENGSGGVLTFTYDALIPGMLTRVTDQNGRYVQFGYEFPANRPPRVVTMTNVMGEVTRFGYNVNAMLTTITWADGTVRTYLYENAIPGALTGIIDEAGVRSATFGYDNRGRAISTREGTNANAYGAAWEFLQGGLARPTKVPTSGSQAYMSKNNSARPRAVRGSCGATHTGIIRASRS